MRIISGRFKNRIIPTIKGADYRPSTSKFREALFSILSSGDFAQEQPLAGASILDLFSGTGIMSFEALSRGAATTMMVDTKVEYLDAAKKFAEKIGEGENVQVYCTNATKLSRSKKQFDIAFLDPPYYEGLCDKVIPLLIDGGWLKNGALVAVELDKREQIKDHKGLELLKEKIYGKNKLLLYRYSAGFCAQNEDKNEAQNE